MSKKETMLPDLKETSL